MTNTKTNMPFTVYQFDKLIPGDPPANEMAVSHHETFNEAADEANSLRRVDRIHSYGVGAN